MTDSVRVAAELAISYAVKKADGNPDKLSGYFLEAMTSISQRLDEIDIKLKDFEAKL